MQVAPSEGQTPRHTAPVFAEAMLVHSSPDLVPGTPVSAARAAGDAIDTDMAGVTPLAQSADQDSVMAGTTPGQSHHCVASPFQPAVHADKLYESAADLPFEPMQASGSDVDVPMLSPQKDLALEDSLEGGTSGALNHDSDMHVLPSPAPPLAPADVTPDRTQVIDVSPPSEATQVPAGNSSAEAGAAL